MYLFSIVSQITKAIFIRVGAFSYPTKTSYSENHQNFEDQNFEDQNFEDQNFEDQNLAIAPFDCDEVGDYSLKHHHPHVQHVVVSVRF
jgi:hypothetical protein